MQYFSRFCIAVIIILLLVSAAAAPPTPPSGTDNIVVSLAPPPGPKKERVDFTFHFVDTDPKDVAKVDFIFVLDRKRYKLDKIDFGEFKTHGCTVSRTVFHNDGTDIARFTISMPPNHNLPPTGRVGVEMIEILGVSAKGIYYVAQLFEPTITLFDGTVRHIEYTEVLK